MKDSTLLKISLILSITGIFVLLFLLEFQEIKSTEIQNITKSKLETQVKIQGIITSIKETPGLYILNVKDNSSIIPIIIFKETSLTLEKNMQVEITGKVQEYQNKLEIIADEIILK